MRKIMARDVGCPVSEMTAQRALALLKLHSGGPVLRDFW